MDKLHYSTIILIKFFLPFLNNTPSTSSDFEIVANALVISEKTVKNHVSNIFKKIDVSDRTQAAVYAIRNGYVEI